jgi:hypothetical protein
MVHAIGVALILLPTAPSDFSGHFPTYHGRQLYYSLTILPHSPSYHGRQLPPSIADSLRHSRSSPLPARGPQPLLFLLFMLNLVAEVAEEALELGMLARAIQR